MKENYTEIESKLLIVAERPKDFLDQISRKSTMTGFNLIKAGRQNIRDRYWDSTDGKLKRERLALRLRKINSRFFLNIKGKTQISRWGGVTRLEIELPYSLTAVKTVEKFLRKNNISLNILVKNKLTDNPLTFIKNTSLRTIQDRETRRLIRQVTSREHPEKILAEMALDIVTYHLKNLVIHQAEIELEAKSSAGIEVIRQITDYLLKKYPHHLRSWTLSKLTTGLAIERLFQENPLQLSLDEQHYLRPEVYDFILKNITAWQE